MKSVIRTLSILGILVNLTVAVAAQDAARDPVKSNGQASPLVGPNTQPPSTPPPPPPAALPEPPRGTSQERLSEEGQWVYTSQYGWVWMPYGDKFTHVPPDGSPPNMYVYYPEIGWSWVVAPWLWGWGVEPYFGHLGSRYYAWYGLGLGRWHGFSGAYALWGRSGRAYWGRGHWNSVSRSYGHSASGGHVSGGGSHSSRGGGHHGGGGHH